MAQWVYSNSFLKGEALKEIGTICFPHVLGYVLLVCLPAMMES